MRFKFEEARARLTDNFPLVDDHPDVAGVLRNRDLLRLLGPALAEPYRDQEISVVISPEARGPILGALTALELGAGLVLARKEANNHPGADIPVESQPTWRGHSELFRGRSFDLTRHDRVVIVDDWITTGSTLRAVGNIVSLLGATYVGASVLVNKATPETIDELLVHSLVDFDAIVAAGGSGERR